MQLFKGRKQYQYEKKMKRQTPVYIIVHTELKMKISEHELN